MHEIEIRRPAGLDGLHHGLERAVVDLIADARLPAFELIPETDLSRRLVAAKRSEDGPVWVMDSLLAMTNGVRAVKIGFAPGFRDDADARRKSGQ